MVMVAARESPVQVQGSRDVYMTIMQQDRTGKSRRTFFKRPLY